jgi:hydroxypyruvate reductase
LTTAERNFLANLFHAAVAAADPLEALRGNLPAPPKGRTVVIGAGKGAAQLAQAFEQLWDAPCEGIVVTRYGYAAECQHIRVLEAAHPVPDKAGLAASAALRKAVRNLGPDDLVIALICGGGSSLLVDPPEGLSLGDLQSLNEKLLSSGAPISVMNDIRKCFSRINGGRLAELAAPARVCTLVVSDVPGDDPAEVASGPTVLDRPDPQAVREMVTARGISLPAACNVYLGALTDRRPKAGHPDSTVKVVASAAISLQAAAAAARAKGVEAWILSDRIEGEAREVAKMHAALAQKCAETGVPYGPPLVLLSGGETTVTLRGSGRGGRNSEFQLSLALAVDGMEAIHALAADTDGIDGSEDNAGAFVDGTTADRLREAGRDPLRALRDNDAYGAFSAISDLFVTGPTGTNVNDFRAILIGNLPG